MTDDLRKRLRAKVDVGSSLLDGLPVNPDGPEAADRIEALTAENERLKRALYNIQFTATRVFEPEEPSVSQAGSEA